MTSSEQHDAVETSPGSLRETLRSQLTIPVIAAPMFLVSGPELAIAACASGVMGTLTLNHCRSLAEFEEQLVTVRLALEQIRRIDPTRVIGPLGANTSLTDDEAEMQGFIDLCARHAVSVVISANGDPAGLSAMAHDAGLSIIHDVTSMKFAEKAIAAGVDGLVAIGSGGGGHSGTISAFAFIPILRSMYDGLIVLAGSITTGAQVRAAEVLGADLVYVGTRFIATQESLAPQAYKDLLVTERAETLVYTRAVNGVHANWMQASLRRVGLDPADLPVAAERGTAHLPPGVRPWRDIWSAGQGVSLIHDVPKAADLVARLRHEYAAACRVPDLAPAAPAGIWS